MTKQRYGLIGHPVKHSLSPAMQSAGFHALGIDAEYLLYDLEPDKLETFLENAKANFFTAWYNPTVNWDDFAGLSFWVKGDGSNSWGGIQLIDGDDYALRYGFAFPIKSTEWEKVVIPWCTKVR